MVLPFVLYTHLYQGARRTLNHKQPSAQASLKSSAAEGKTFKGKFSLIDIFTILVEILNPQQ